MRTHPTLARALAPRTAGAAAQRLAAVVVTALIAFAMVLGGAPVQSIAAAPAPSAPAAAPLRPADQTDRDVQLDLVSMGPASLAPGGTLTAEVAVTNTGTSALPAPALELRALTPRVTQRTVLDAWQADTDPEASGDVKAASVVDPAAPAAPIPPGATATLSVSVPADALGFSSAPDLWGARRIALTVTGSGTPLATLRTFVVWRPAGATEQISQSVLLPVAASDPGQAATDPAAFEASASDGALRGLVDLAARPDVDWLLDPALLAPPSIRTDEQPAPADAADPAADDGSDGSAASDAGGGAPAQTPIGTYAPSPAGTALAEDLRGAAGGRTVLTLPFARADLVSLDAADVPRLSGLIADRGRAALASAGIVPAAQAVSIDGAEVSPAALAEAEAAGAGVVIAPSASFRTDPEGTITPSSVGTLGTGQDAVAVLAPDTVLSDEFSSLTPGSDGEQTSQRLLAETAVISTESSAAPRHVLIQPDPEARLDPEAAGRALDALDQAPWIRRAPTSALLDAARAGRWAPDPQDDSGALYALGALEDDEAHPSSRRADGSIALPDAPAPTAPLPAATLTRVDDAADRLSALRGAMEDPAQSDAADLALLSCTTVRWRGGTGPDDMARRADEAIASAQALEDLVVIVPASGYNLIASAADVPVTVTNGLDTPIRAELVGASDQPILRVTADPAGVEIPARGQASARIPVEAVANGRATLEVHLRGPDGSTVGRAETVSLTVNPSWENWTTMAVVALMGLLVVVGVARARRTGSSTRAPAVRVPEDPVVLARTGRSEPQTDDADPGDGTDGMHRGAASLPDDSGARAEDGR
ncbi:DUF6049 family protein [Brachybacterium huguangmaarense]